MKMIAMRASRAGLIAAAAAAAALAACAAPAAVCRVTDYTDRPLASLNMVERLSLLSDMSPTEFMKFKAAPQSSPDYDPIVAANATAPEARTAARAKLQALGVENADDYRKVWASDFLTDDGLKKYLDCTSGRFPGLTLAGRSASPSEFHLAFVHVTPIGIEKITTKVIASDNIANVDELKASLAALGPQDNYTARIFPLRIKEPTKRAVLVMRGGWETPKFIYIPPYPTADYFHQ